MRKYALILCFLVTSIPAFAQDRDDSWRRRRYTPSRSLFELTPTVGYRWGGTIFADQTLLFDQDVDVQSSAAYGLNFGIPLGDSGMKLELMANHQSSELELEGGLFDPGATVADIDVNYYHAGLQFPFARSRNVIPYFVVSAGVANLDLGVLGVSDETKFSASAGIGVKAPISDNVAIRFEGRGYYTALEDDNDCRICDYYYNRDFYQGEVSLGLVFSF